MTLDNFQEDCSLMPLDIVVRKNLIEGGSYFFEDLEMHEEFQFKKDLAESINVHLRNIVVVGSGKLGFSIKPDKDNNRLCQYKAFDYAKQVINDRNQRLHRAKVISSVITNSLA